MNYNTYIYITSIKKLKFKGSGVDTGNYVRSLTQNKKNLLLKV